MPLSKEDRQKIVRTQPRDEHGHFIPQKPTIQTNEHHTKNPMNILTSLVRAEKGDDEDTMIDVKVTNPLKRISRILQDIKNHQSTTFSLRFTIPLIALPIFLLIAFQLGKTQSACPKVYITRIGILKTTTVMQPQEIQNPLGFLSWLPFFEPKRGPLAPTTKILLIEPDNQVLTINPTTPIQTIPYINKPVLLTGDYSSCEQTITLESPQNISLQ